MKSMLQDPFSLFDDWFAGAKKNGVFRPNAVALATAEKNGIPSMRMVLFKEVTNKKIIFYTNYNSKKAIQIDENPHVALLFYWDNLHRQIIIEGEAQKTDIETSENYFKTRPRESQLSAWASPQGQSIPNREFLIEKFHQEEKRFLSKDVPCPHFWGGYAITPCYFEFWEGREKRLHERLCFRLKDKNWKIEQLAP